MVAIEQFLSLFLSWMHNFNHVSAKINYSLLSTWFYILYGQLCEPYICTGRNRTTPLSSRECTISNLLLSSSLLCSSLLLHPIILGVLLGVLILATRCGEGPRPPVGHVLTRSTSQKQSRPIYYLVPDQMLIKMSNCEFSGPLRTQTSERTSPPLIAVSTDAMFAPKAGTDPENWPDGRKRSCTNSNHEGLSPGIWAQGLRDMVKEQVLCLCILASFSLLLCMVAPPKTSAQCAWKSRTVHCQYHPDDVEGLLSTLV